jgi:FMN-dependent NADH-azoreductase
LNIQARAIREPCYEENVMKLLRVDASIQGQRSASGELADLVLAEWSAARPEATVVRRSLGSEPLPGDAWALAVSAGFTPDDRRTEAQQAAHALAVALADEVRAAEAVVLAFPLYNFGISQHVKTWIDLVIAGGVHGERMLAGKPVVLVTTRGGAYGPGTPREGWDHNTGYLRQILVDVWGADLTVVEREFTLVGVNPALDEFTELAALMHKASREQAVSVGQALAGR